MRGLSSISGGDMFREWIIQYPAEFLALGGGTYNSCSDNSGGKVLTTIDPAAGRPVVEPKPLDGSCGLVSIRTLRAFLNIEHRHLRRALTKCCRQGLGI